MRIQKLLLTSLFIGLVPSLLVDCNKNEIDIGQFNSTKCNAIVSHEVLATKYNAVESQCDSDPLITADNSKIDVNKLNNYKLKWIAISRDLKEHYKFGDTVIVKCDNVKLNGKWVVRDVMNKRFTNRIDFLCPVNDNYDFNKPITVTITKHDS